MEPRWIRHTLPLMLPATAAVPRPKLASAPAAATRGDPSIGRAATPAPPTDSDAPVWLNAGTVDCTATPGAAISTSALNCENEATAFFSSIAATDITSGKPAGYD